MKTHFSASLIFAALMLIRPAGADEAKTYKLKVARIPVAGEKTQTNRKLTSESARKLTVNGKKVNNETEDLHGDATGVLELLEVSPHGKAQKIQFTVEKFKCQKDVDAEEEPFKPGTVITGKLGAEDKEIFTVDGNEVEETAGKVLKELFELAKDRENDVPDDVIFRTDQPRAPGTEWEMDKAALIKSMPDKVPFVLKESDITAKVKFVEIKTVNGVECAVLKAEAVMKPSGVKGLGKFKADKVSFSITGDMFVPLDEKAVSPMEKTRMEMHLNGSVAPPDGNPRLAGVLESFAISEKESESKPAK